MNRVHEQCPKILLRHSTKSKRAKNKLGAPSAQPWPARAPSACAAPAAGRPCACCRAPAAPACALRTHPRCACAVPVPRTPSPCLLPAGRVVAWLAVSRPCVATQSSSLKFLLVTIHFVYCDLLPQSSCPFSRNTVNCIAIQFTSAQSSPIAIQFYVLQYNSSQPSLFQSLYTWCIAIHH